MPPQTFQVTKFCPRCDKRFVGTGTDAEIAGEVALGEVKKHVTKAHPDYDPEWADDSE